MSNEATRQAHEDGSGLVEEELTKRAYNVMGADWFYSHNDLGFYRAEMDRFHELLPSGSVLEIGACGGRDAKELIALGYDYVGTDISDKLVEVARQEVPAAEFYAQGVHDLHFSDKNLFDGFWAAAVLLHIPKRRIDQALLRIASVVKPGGIGFISLSDGIEENMEDKQVKPGTTVQRLFARWPKEEFTQTLHDNGYGIVDYMYKPHPVENWHCFFVKTPQSGQASRQTIKMIR